MTYLRDHSFNNLRTSYYHSLIRGALLVPKKMAFRLFFAAWLLSFHNSDHKIIARPFVNACPDLFSAACDQIFNLIIIRMLVL
jgi:hypothetical protein